MQCLTSKVFAPKLGEGTAIQEIVKVNPTGPFQCFESHNYLDIIPSLTPISVVIT